MLLLLLLLLLAEGTPWILYHGWEIVRFGIIHPTAGSATPARVESFHELRLAQSSICRTLHTLHAPECQYLFAGKHKIQQAVSERSLGEHAVQTCPCPASPCLGHANCSDQGHATFHLYPQCSHEAQLLSYPAVPSQQSIHMNSTEALEHFIKQMQIASSEGMSKAEVLQ
jgi:hypothetical protein